MSIPVEITRLQTAKADIKEAIENNGVSVPNEARLDDYPPYIYAIQEDDPYNGHDYVEIAGMKWATMNIGANSITDYGLYFQWGDTTGYLSGNVGTSSTSYKKPFAWADYDLGNGTTSPGTTGLTKYNSTDGKDVLDNSDDPVSANWGGQWRLPTTEEFQALGNVVNTAWTASYQGSGVAGLVCTDKTDSSKVLFFPAAGRCYNGSVGNVGSIGGYWSSSLFSSNLQLAYFLYFYSNDTFWDGNNGRFYGFSVRGIINEREYPTIITAPSAKSGLVYNGNAQVLLSGGSADVSGVFTYGTAINAGSYDGTWTFTPTDLGRYNKVNGTIPASIAKANPTISANPAAKSGLVYTRSAQALLSGGTASVAGTFTYGTGTNAGTYSNVSWTFTPTDTTNYNTKTGTVSSASIAKVTPVLATSPTKASDWTYDGTSHALASGGSMKHSSTDSTAVAGTFSYGSATDAGGYPATWSFTPTDVTNYKSTYGNVGSVTVSKAEPTITAPTAKTGLVYNGSLQTLYNAGSNTTPGSFDYSNGTGTDAGTRTVGWSFTPTDTTNYNNKSGAFDATIARANRTMSWSSAPSSVEKGKTVTATATRTGDGSIVYSSSTTSIATINSSTGVISGVASGSCTIKASVAQTTNYKSASITYTLSVTDPYAGHAYVEIAGIKWATMNIGASSVTNYGKYFQWGDVSGYTSSQVGSGSGKKYFGWADYKYGNGTSSPGATGMTKYNSTDGKTVLDITDDAARANWGGAWRMPTKTEYYFLGASVNTAWTASYQGSGVAGLVCTDKTDSSKVLFFPAAGNCGDGSVGGGGTYGWYWSSSLLSSSMQRAYTLDFNNGGGHWQINYSRYLGLPVRPVAD